MKNPINIGHYQVQCQGSVSDGTDEWQIYAIFRFDDENKPLNGGKAVRKLYGLGPIFTSIDRAEEDDIVKIVEQTNDFDKLVICKTQEIVTDMVIIRHPDAAKIICRKDIAYVEEAPAKGTWSYEIYYEYEEENLCEGTGFQTAEAALSSARECKVEYGWTDAHIRVWD